MLQSELIHLIEQATQEKFNVNLRKADTSYKYKHHDKFVRWAFVRTLVEFKFHTTSIHRVIGGCSMYINDDPINDVFDDAKFIITNITKEFVDKYGTPDTLQPDAKLKRGAQRLIQNQQQKQPQSINPAKYDKIHINKKTYAFIKSNTEYRCAYCAFQEDERLCEKAPCTEQDKFKAKGYFRRINYTL